MDCAQALEYLYDLLDRELTPELEEQVTEHFTSCRNCFPLYQFEVGFARFLRARAETREAPAALRRRILDRIMQEGEEP